MTALMLQSALLLLIAYFAGCFLGCLARRMTFQSEARADGALERGALQPAPVAAAPAAPSASPAAAAGPAASRFERALTGAGPTAAQPAPTPSAAPAGQPITPVRAAPAPQPPTPPPAASGPTPQQAAVAAAATAAATAATAAAKASTSPAAVPASAPAPILPAAMGSSGPASVTAPVAPQPAAPPAPAAAPVPAPKPPAATQPVQPAPAPAPAATAADDLTRIRAIDPVMQSSLQALGVRSFATIAGWKPDDVARVSSVLKIPGRIEQENWIEQAQILAKGGETYYSRRKLRGELPTAKPTPDEGDKITVRVPAPSRPAADAPQALAPLPTPIVVPVTVPTPVHASASAPVAAPIQAPMAAPASPAPSAGDVKAAASAAAAAVQAAQAAIAPAAAAAAAGVAAVGGAKAPNPVPVPVPAPAPVTAVPAAAQKVDVPAPPVPQPAPAVGMSRDPLQRIAGINSEVEKLLNVQGVTRYAQIANWSTADIARFDRLLGFEGRIARENWIEQANILAKGGETAYARDQARRASESSMPAKLADAIQGQRAAAPAPIAAPMPAPAPPPAGETASRPELANLRSVRSEAYRGSDSSGPAVPGGRAADDLKRIRGVGVLIEKKLNALGVTRYDQVANWTQADIERFSDKLDFKGRIERENWVEQARILSAGGQTEFSQRVDRGEVESSKLT